MGSKTMLILRGSPALSPFRLEKLRQDLAGTGAEVRAVGADFVHVASVSRPLTAAEEGVLAQLLTYGPRRAPAQVTGLTQVVAPRAGRMVVFPATLPHEVRPYLGERPRISVAFNAAIETDRAKLAGMTQEIGLSDVIEAGAKVLAGQVRGRIVVKIL